MLMALQRWNIGGLPAECGGGDPESPPHIKPFDFYSFGPLCNTCQVIIPQSMNSQVPKSKAETLNLDTSPWYVESNSRLACCIQMEKWMDGMTIKIGHNIL